jgi:hypothetical protein
MNLFKETLGFDTDQLSNGTAIEITDNRKLRLGGFYPMEDENNPFLPLYTLISGSYLIQSAHADVIQVIGTTGKKYLIHSRYFLGDTPELTLEKFHKVKKS